MAIYIIGKLKQKNNGKFALLDATDVEMPDGRRLSECGFVAIEDVKDLFVPITQEEYDALEASGTVDMDKYYYIKKEEVK